MGKRAGVGAPGGGSLSSAIAARPRTATASAVRPRSPAAAAAAAPAAAAVTAGTGAVAGAPVTVPAPLPVPDVRRGSLAAALQASETEESRQAALDALERDRYALTTAKSRASWLSTWIALHNAAFRQLPVPPAPFPLSCESIRRTASLFKAGGYLSFENYAKRAKSEHLSLGLRGHGAWSTELSAAMASAIRSVGRGAGASRQSKPLDAVAVAGLECLRGISRSPALSSC